MSQSLYVQQTVLAELRELSGLKLGPQDEPTADAFRLEMNRPRTGSGPPSTVVVEDVIDDEHTKNIRTFERAIMGGVGISAELMSLPKIRYGERAVAYRYSGRGMLLRAQVLKTVVLWVQLKMVSIEMIRYIWEGRQERQRRATRDERCPEDRERRVHSISEGEGTVCDGKEGIREQE